MQSCSTDVVFILGTQYSRVLRLCTGEVCCKRTRHESVHCSGLVSKEPDLTPEKTSATVLQWLSGFTEAVRFDTGAWCLLLLSSSWVAAFKNCNLNLQVCDAQNRCDYQDILENSRRTKHQIKTMFFFSFGQNLQPSPETLENDETEIYGSHKLLSRGSWTGRRAENGSSISDPIVSIFKKKRMPFHLSFWTCLNSRHVKPVPWVACFHDSTWPPCKHVHWNASGGSPPLVHSCAQHSFTCI